MKAKISDFWFYYKWYLLVGLLVLLLIVSFIVEKNNKVEPDYIVSFVTQQQISEGDRDILSQYMGSLLDDTNGDRQVYVQINLYAYDAQAMDAKDPNAFMAAAVQLSAELQLRQADIYITDKPAFLIEEANLRNVGCWGDYSKLSNTVPEFQSFVILSFQATPAILTAFQ